MWSKKKKIFPKEPGNYAVYNKKGLIYVGETRNIQKRMEDLGRTQNHTLRRKLGEDITGTKKPEKGFTQQIEGKITKYLEKNIKVSCLTTNLGRKEIEERIIEEKNPKYNRAQKR